MSSKTATDLLKLTDKLLSQLDDPISEERSEQFVEDLRSAINFHDQKYYVESSHVISDQDYDRLFNKLKELEDSYPNLITPDSPTQRVAKGLNAEFPTVQHLVPMMSLDNSYNLSDLEEFDRRVREALVDDSKIVYSVEPKYDGSSIALVYENDVLVRAATRGNGAEGDEITANAKAIKSIPLRANFSKYGIYKIEIRGEALLELSVLEKLNAERTKQNEVFRKEGKKELELYKNARNTAAGSLRLKDPKEVAARKLDAVLYQVGYAEDKQGLEITHQFETHTKNLEILHQLGFKTSHLEKSNFDNIEGVEQFCAFWENIRDSYPFDIDGMVVKVDSLKQQQLIGKTSHHPKWAVAYKFKARQAISVLRRVDFQVGRTGAITPVAKIDPVQLVGVEIASISLHNEDFINDKDLRLGDHVIVERAGDVIPYIVGSLPERRSGKEHKIHFPEKCPSCRHTLVKPLDESAWRCINPNCPAQLEEHLIHFVSKEAMDISGLGEEIIRTFLAEKIIRDIPSIYEIDYERVRQLEGWKDKSVQNLRDGVEGSKNKELWRLIVGLGIRHIGVATAKMLATQVENLADFKDWKEEDYLQLQDIGPKVAQALFQYFTDAETIALIQKLAELGVNIEKTELKLDSEKLQGKSFLFTGTLTRFSRDEAKILVEKNGGKNLSAVSAQLDFLVAGEKAGSKLAKALKIPTIRVIDEDEFLKMIE
jgi:DNA ligase (NAD+)